MARLSWPRWLGEYTAYRLWPRNQNQAVTQFGITDFCKCSFDVDDVVFLIIRIITGNFDIVNMYKC